MYVRLHDPHEPGFDFLGVDLGYVPQVPVEPILAGCQHAQLRTTLPAVQQEHFGIQHLRSEFGRERISEMLDQLEATLRPSQSGSRLCPSGCSLQG